MWTTTIKQLTFNGTVSVSLGGGTPPLPLLGVRVDVYRFFIDPDGNTQFEQLNQVAEKTSITGDFSFTDLPVSVQVQTVIPGGPPYKPVEITNPGSLPNLGFRISVEAEVLTSGTSQGTQFVDIYDEREAITSDWVTSHPERLNVELSGSLSIPVLISEENEEAVLVAGITLPSSPVPGKEFHFLRIGRATRDEIGEVGTSKQGYMNSASPSFFPNIVDAPFGGKLQIGGHFGADLLTGHCGVVSDRARLTVLPGRC
jgi:hypothetical protein